MADKTKKKKSVIIDALTPKERLFANHYLTDFHQLGAMKRAGYRGTDATLSTQASRLLKKPKIAAFIKRRLDELNERIQITQDAILQETAVIAFSDITEFLSWDDDGEVVFRPSREIHMAKRRAIESFTVKDTKHGKQYTLKLHSKIAALGRLGEHKKLWRDANADDHPGDLLSRALFLVPGFLNAGPQAPAPAPATKR